MKLMKWEKIYTAGVWKIEARRGSNYVLIHPDGFEEEFKKLVDAKARAEECRRKSPRFTPCMKCGYWGKDGRCDWWGEKTRPDDYCSIADPRK